MTAPTTTSDEDHVLVDQLCRVVADVPGDVREVVGRHVGAVAPLVHGERRRRLIDAAVARLAGLDALDLLLADPEVDEVLVNRGGDVWIERAGQLHAVASIPSTALAVVFERVLAPLGRRLDRTSPIVDARLPDGSRVCAVVEPVAVDGAALAIRRFRSRSLPLESFCTPQVAEVLREIVLARCNVIVAGGTSTGKTSLLSALLTFVDPGERIVVLEDTAELRPERSNVVRLEARAATVDGLRAIGLDELVRTALRLRPDRLVVGEVRGDEVLALVQAMNTGHDGSLSTCHANSARDALARLETLVMQAAPSWPLPAIRSQLTRSVDVIVHVTRTSTSARRVSAVAEVILGDGPPDVRMLADEAGRCGELRRARSS